MHAYTWNDDAKPSWFNVNDVVAIHPATDLWMRGVRFARVVKIGRKFLTVHDAMSNTTHRVPARICATK